jgi:hypothetical protein
VVSWASGLVFMFCTPGLVLGGTEDAGSHFHILRSQTRFGRYRGLRIQFSCFALPDPFSVVPRASGPVSCFALLDSFWAVPWASDQVFMFCAPKLVLGGTMGVGSRFHILRSRTRFGRYRGLRIQFSCFALPDPFSVVPRASGPVSCFALLDSFWAVPWVPDPVFMFCASSLFFRRYQGRISCMEVCLFQ